MFLSNKKLQTKTQKPINKQKPKIIDKNTEPPFLEKKESCLIPNVLFFSFKGFSCTRLLFILSPLLKEHKEYRAESNNETGKLFYPLFDTH